MSYQKVEAVDVEDAADVYDIPLDTDQANNIAEYLNLRQKGVIETEKARKALLGLAADVSKVLGGSGTVCLTVNQLRDLADGVTPVQRLGTRPR